MAEAAPTMEKYRVVDGATVRRISERAGEGAAILGRRIEALAILEHSPLPDRVRHLWRFTDPARLLPGQIEAQAQPVVPGPGAAVPAGGSGVVLGSGGGGFTVELSAGAERAGVRLLPMSEAPEELLAGLGVAVPASMGYFEALNLAAFTAGVVLDVPAGVELEEPLRLVMPAASGAYLPRVLVRAGEGSRLTVLEEHLGGGADSRMVSATEIAAEAGAHVRHVIHQHWNPGVRGHLSSRSRIARDAKVTTVVVSVGGEVSKFNVGAILDEPGAESEIGGVVLGTGRQHMDHHTMHDHRAGHTLSNIDFKVALTGRARSAYTGLIRIEKGAAGSEAYQENRNLLLSDGARADTIPELEILTDDVQCTHGATVAPMDDEQVFYLESRGIPPNEARRLIVQGFLEAALSRLPEALREELEAGLTGDVAQFLGSPEGS